MDEESFYTQPDTDEEAGLNLILVYAGRSLTDSSVTPIHILTDNAGLELLHHGNISYWRNVLRVIAMERSEE